MERDADREELARHAVRVAELRLRGACGVHGTNRPKQSSASR